VRTRRRHGLAALALGIVVYVAAGAAIPAEADQMVANVPPVFYLGLELSAYHGLIVMGGHSLNGPPSYFAVRGGVVTRLPINAPTRVLGGLDLGPGREGGTEAAYERCRDVTSMGEGSSECDIYRYGFGSHRTSRVRGASSRRYEETSPSVWRGRIAFVRSRLNREGLPVSVGPQLGVFATPPLVGLAHVAPTAHTRTSVGVRETDIRGHTLAYVTFRNRLPRAGVLRLLVKRVDRRAQGRACELVHGTGGTLDSPELDGDYVYWRRGRFGANYTWTIHRRRLPGANCRSRGPEQVLPRTFRPTYEPSQTVQRFSFAVDQGHLYYSVDVTDHPEDGSGLWIDHGEIWEVQPATFKDL
jgi:hypothetical protein